MKPAPFDYCRAESADEAIGLLSRHGDDARVLAGGQSLISMLNMRLVTPELLIDISRAQDLRAISTDANRVRVGAAVTQAALAASPNLAEMLPLLAAALPHVGHYQTRSKGTVCGSLAHADPASEIPLCLAVLGGEIELASRRGIRRLAAVDFSLGLLTTARESDELIMSASFPRARPAETFAFTEMSARHGDFAIIAVAVKLTHQAINIGIGGASDKPEVRSLPALEGKALDDALNAIAWEITTQSDIHASVVYRRHLIRTLGRSTVMEARSCLY